MSGTPKGRAAVAEAAEPVIRPLRRDAELNRQRILVAADEVFAEHGLDATLDDIAEHARLGVGTVYRRFADKQALVDALFAQHLCGLAQIADEALLQPDPWEGVVYLLEGTLAQQAANRGLREVLLHSDTGSGAICLARERVVPAIAKVFERAQAAGVLRDDLVATDIPFLCLMIGSVAENSAHVDPELWRRYLTIVLDGMRPRRNKTRPMPVNALTPEQVEVALHRAPQRRRPPCAE